jgi:neutral/alkaline ceramidase-like enzyme
MNYLMAGAGRSDITPAPGTPQGGWGAQTHQRGIASDMPLYATTLVVSDSAESVAIIDVDSIGFDLEWAKKIVDAVADLTNLRRDHIRLSWTHTHSGPNTFRLATIGEGKDMVLSYMEGLPRRIAGSVWQAQQRLKPVRCGAASGTCEINVNRRLKLPDGRIVVGKNWSGPVDRTVRVMRFDDLEENAVATIVHYACHPTTMAWQNQYFTPDYPGVTRQVVEQQIGGLCLFLQGAAGNITPRQGFTGDRRVYRRLGKLLGLEASRVAIGIETLAHPDRLEGVLQSGAPIALYSNEPVEQSSSCLRTLSRSLKLPLRSFPPLDESKAESDRLLNELTRWRREGTETEVQAARALATQACMQAEMSRLYSGKTHTSWQLQGIRIGSVAMLSIPGEPFTEINEQIVKASPFAHTLFSGYSNGGLDYLAVRSAFDEGGYEIGMCPFAPEAAEIVVEECLDMLEKLAAKGT